MKLKYYQEIVLENLAKKLDTPPLEVLDNLMWNGCKVMKSDVDLYQEAATELVNFVAIRAFKNKVGAELHEDKKIKCESCNAKIGVNALDYEFKDMSEAGYNVEKEKCPVCGFVIREERKKLKPDEQIDESECVYDERGHLVLNKLDDD